MYTNQDPIVQATPTRVIAVEDDRPVAVTTARVDPVATRRVATTSRSRYTFDSIIVGVVGLALTIVGLLAVTRAGTHGPMDTPVVRVLGFTHTETLGIIEVVIGVLLLISALATSRGAAMFFGLVLGVGGFIGAVQTSSFKRSLALESGLAWMAVIAGAVVVLASVLLPRMITETATIETD
jgi:uncharacterized membrane protein HdeD (DUF308 family)